MSILKAKHRTRGRAAPDDRARHRDFRRAAGRSGPGYCRPAQGPVGGGGRGDPGNGARAANQPYLDPFGSGQRQAFLADPGSRHGRLEPIGPGSAADRGGRIARARRIDHAATAHRARRRPGRIFHRKLGLGRARERGPDPGQAPLVARLPDVRAGTHRRHQPGADHLHADASPVVARRTGTASAVDVFYTFSFK